MLVVVDHHEPRSVGSLLRRAASGRGHPLRVVRFRSGAKGRARLSGRPGHVLCETAATLLLPMSGLTPAQGIGGRRSPGPTAGEMRSESHPTCPIPTPGHPSIAGGTRVARGPRLHRPAPRGEPRAPGSGHLGGAANRGGELEDHRPARPAHGDREYPARPDGGGGERAARARAPGAERGAGGVKQEDTEAIFDNFRRVDQSSTRKYGGTGLVFSITRKMSRRCR